MLVRAPLSVRELLRAPPPDRGITVLVVQPLSQGEGSLTGAGVSLGFSRCRLRAAEFDSTTPPRAAIFPGTPESEHLAGASSGREHQHDQQVHAIPLLPQRALLDPRQQRTLPAGRERRFPWLTPCSGRIARAPRRGARQRSRHRLGAADSLEYGANALRARPCGPERPESRARLKQSGNPSLLRRIASSWRLSRGSRDARVGGLLQAPIRERITHLMRTSATNGAARVALAAHLANLFVVDTAWTEECLLPYFDWKADRVAAHRA